MRKRGFFLLAAIILLLAGCEKKKADASEDITVFEKPDRMVIDNGETTACLEAGTEEYEAVYEALKKGWKESLDKNGRLEFVMSTHVDSEPEGPKLICGYSTAPKKWTMYGEGEGEEISGTTYTFFPYSGEYMDKAVISEDGNYLERAYTVKMGNLAEVQEVLEEQAPDLR